MIYRLKEAIDGYMYSTHFSRTRISFATLHTLLVLQGVNSLEHQVVERYLGSKQPHPAPNRFPPSWTRRTSSLLALDVLPKPQAACVRTFAVS